MIINLTQHTCSVEQAEQGVQDLHAQEKEQLAKLLTFEQMPTKEEIKARAESVAALANKRFQAGHHGHAMIGGAPFFMAALEQALLAVGISPIYAFSVRESVEQVQADGSIRKVAVFRHLGFVEAA